MELANTLRNPRETYDAVEARQGKDVPELLSVKPHVLFKWLFELGTTPTLLDAIEDLMGSNILLTTCAIWPKDAHDPRFVTWHQDSAYFGYDPMEVWSASIAITDSHVDNGCLKYLPGSHNDPEMLHEETHDPLSRSFWPPPCFCPTTEFLSAGTLCADILLDISCFLSRAPKNFSSSQNTAGADGPSTSTGSGLSEIAPCARRDRLERV